MESHALTRHDAVIRRADAAADAANRAVLGLWRDVLALLRDAPQLGPARLWQQSLALFRRLRPVAADGLRIGLTDLVRWSNRATARRLVRAVPTGYLRQAVIRRGLDRQFSGAQLESVSRAAVLTEDFPGLLSLFLDWPTVTRRRPGHGVLASGGVVSYVPHRNASRGEVTVLVDPARLSAAWSQDQGFITASGGGAEIGGRRTEFAKFLARGEPVQASRVTLGNDGVPAFVDGRHRFSVLRDQGATAVAVTVPRSEADDFRARFGVPPVLTAKPLPTSLDDLSELLFPPPPEWLTRQRVDRIIAPFLAAPRPDLVPPEQLASVLVQGYSQGKTQQEIARDLLPHVDGVRASARRVARTWGVAAANDEQLAVHEQIDDLIIGYTIRSARKWNSRRAHVLRDGTEYYRNPQPGQLGFDVMPRPPREADGTLAWSCLCYLEPIFAEFD